MVKVLLVVRYYVVILTVLGCVSAFELYSYTPRESGTHVLDESGRWVFDEFAMIDITIYGSELHTGMTIFVSQTTNCEDRSPLGIVGENSKTYSLDVSGELPTYEQDLYYICIIDDERTEHRDTKSLELTLKNIGFQVPMAVRIVAALILLIFSGLFSGLNLGLMSLDLTSLRILKETGTTAEQRYAKQIEPVRKQGNFLLCTLLLGNVLVNNTLTILLDTLFGGLFAVLGSTGAIVIMGEIIPQAICQRFGLVVGAKTLFITKIFMVITCPLSWPISKLLDAILGQELGTFYRREQLKELLMLTENQHNMHKEEVNMITGVLSINDKSVREIMTDISDVFMLCIETKINFEVMQDIMNRGFSRIPVWEVDEHNIVGLLFVKDLAFVDPDDELPLASVIKFYRHPAHRVLADTKVLQLMNDFMKERYHMAIVNDIDNEGDGDPKYITIGVITLEDIIEEIIQQEIVDETDVYENNENKKKNEKKVNQLFPNFAKDTTHAIKISPQLLLATFTFLSTQISEFGEEYMSSAILNKLLRQDVVKELEPGSKPIIERGKNVEYMIMVLTGEVKVQVSKEDIVFEQGPFSTLCVPALRGPYVADVTVFPSSATAQYLCIYREDYKRAIETSEWSKDQPDHDSLNTSRPSTPTKQHVTTTSQSRDYVNPQATRLSEEREDVLNRDSNDTSTLASVHVQIDLEDESEL